MRTLTVPLEMDSTRDAHFTANDAGCLLDDACNDSEISDANLQLDFGTIPDAQPVDEGRPMTPYVDDPLAVPQETFFECDSQENFNTPVRIWRMTDTQYRRQLDAMIRGESRTNLAASNPFSGLHSGEQFSQLAHVFGMDDPTFDLLRQSASAVTEFILSLQGRWLLPECAAEDRVDDTDECLRETMRHFARVAWRRPA